LAAGVAGADRLQVLLAIRVKRTGSSLVVAIVLPLLGRSLAAGAG
jgi:hypothetical protein